MTEAWFVDILYSCPEPWGGEGNGVSGVAEKEYRKNYGFLYSGLLCIHIYILLHWKEVLLHLAC